MRHVTHASLSSGEALAAYETDGCVIIDSPFSSEQIDRVEAAWDHCTETGMAAFDDNTVVDAIQHPFWEDLAKQFLRASDVVYWWSVGPHNRPPTPRPPEGYPSWQEEWAAGAHTDIQLTRSDWEATPRRNRCEVWWWLNDVPASRGAMRIMPGSMHTSMDHWEHTLSAQQKQCLPRVNGYEPESG